MGLFKCLLWAAGGVGAVVLAPATGGGSLAVLVGAAGTTTLAGAGIGAAGGLAVKAVINEITDEREEKISYYRTEAEINKAGWQQSEMKRQEEAEKHKEEMSRMNYSLEKLAEKYGNAIEELRKNRFTIEEAELMFTLAAAAAQADGVCSEDELKAATSAISLLCAQPDEALTIGEEIFKSKVSVEDAIRKIRTLSNISAIRRLGFVMNVVVYADDYVDVQEQELLYAFSEHARSFGVSVAFG